MKNHLFTFLFGAATGQLFTLLALVFVLENLEFTFQIKLWMFSAFFLWSVCFAFFMALRRTSKPLLG